MCQHVSFLSKRKRKSPTERHTIKHVYITRLGNFNTGIFARLMPIDVSLIFTTFHHMSGYLRSRLSPYDKKQISVSVFKASINQRKTCFRQLSNATSAAWMFAMWTRFCILHGSGLVWSPPSRPGGSILGCACHPEKQQTLQNYSKNVWGNIFYTSWICCSTSSSDFIFR